MNRENLLITTIGTLDYISSWLQDDRNFDIALVYYPSTVSDKIKSTLENLADFVFYEQGFKYSVLKSVLEKNPDLLDYEYYWMPDDDIKMVKGTVNSLFELSKKYSLGLSQPSTTSKNISWKLVRHKPGYILRYSNFVEVMCPLFSKSALAECLNSFSYTKSGWGLDILWPTLIKEDVAIIDEIVVKHTKKISLEGGALYKKLLEETGKTPWQELKELEERHNLKSDPRILSYVYKISPMGLLRKIMT